MVTTRLSKLAQQVVESLKASPGLKAKQLANELQVNRKQINQLLYGKLIAYVEQDDDFRWYIRADAPALQTKAKAKAKVPSANMTKPVVESALHPEHKLKSHVEHFTMPNPNAQSSTNSSVHKDFSFESLQSLRQRLLDLSGRNKLISYRHTKTNSVRVVDELLDQLFDRLLAGKSMQFAAVPEPRRQELIDAGMIIVDAETGQETQIKKPMAKEWAKHIGLDTSYELPIGGGDALKKHQDNEIQTLMFPPEMESRLRALRSKANTAIEETGANVLFLVFGFLEWRESNDSDQARSAPLLMLPVTLKKGKLDSALGTYRYELTYSNEDLLPNLSLREKMRQEFGLALPSFDDVPMPEEYLAEVKSVIDRHQPKWRIHRHCTLTMLDFSKQLMYFDLDPERWPKGQGNIIEHPLVKRFFESSDEDSQGGFSSEYRIDELKELHQQYPLIDDADSSQHSALIDAIKGKNLVIEGPPGTGKSQTITNLIAAAIAQGKKVLFVAEKMAALEVVKHRLDRAGLGDFCLELHSHKTQKRQVLDDISQRIAQQGNYVSPRQIKTEIKLYESNRAKLTEYAEKLNTTWKQTGKTVQQILASAVRYRSDVEEQWLELDPERFNGDSLEPANWRSLQDQAEIFVDIYQQMAAQCEQQKLEAHPWYGVKNRDLAPFEFDKLVAPLQAWLSNLQPLQQLLEGTEFQQLNVTANLPWPQLDKQLKRLTELPTLAGDENLGLLVELSTPSKLDKFTQLLADYQQLHEQHQLTAEFFGPQLIEHETLQVEMRSALSHLSGATGNDNLSPEQLTTELSRADKCLDQIEQIERLAADIHPHLSEQARCRVTNSLEGLDELWKLFDFAQQLPAALVRSRDERFDDSAFDPLLESLQTELTQWQAQQRELQSVFQVERLPQASELNELCLQLKEGNLFSWFSSDWRKARKAALNLANNNVNLNAIIEALPKAASYKKDEHLLVHNNDYQEAFGDLFRGTGTKLESLTQLRNWYRALRNEYGIGFSSRAVLADSLLTMPAQMLLGLQNLTSQPEYQNLTATLAELKKLQVKFPKHPAFANQTQELLDSSLGLVALRDALSDGLQAIQPQLLQQQIPVKEVSERLAQVLEIKPAQQQWCQHIQAANWDSMLGLKIGPNDYSESKLKWALRHQYLAENTNDLPLLAELLRQERGDLAYNELCQKSTLAHEQLLKCSESAKQFASAAQMKPAHWNEFSGDSVSQMVARNQQALAKTDYLNTWVDYLNCQHRMEEQGLGQLTKAVEQHVFSADGVGDALAAAFYSRLAQDIMADAPDIMRYSGKEQTALQAKFCEYDNALKKLNQQKIAYQASKHSAPPGNSGGKVATYTEMSLIKHEISKKTRHIPIRQLVKRAGRSLIEIKPCFMMGPMSVAQYLEPGQIEFDLVVMDEASQVKPEDAIGCIARGKQLVVVGDPKQLPPTSFFDRAIDTEDEEVSAIEESESILDTTTPMFGCRRLRWHYRSRHESLIAFSNHSFYDSDLVVFPSPFASTDEYGVKFTHINKGRFVNRRNIEEARVIAHAVAHHLKTRPDESLGVVAMSADQREQIERSIEELSKNDTILQNALAQDRDEPLFVKNLENVQGDERDVIFISFTYGPKEVGGPVPQRFGPINTAAGWRRLNVLFTRSKKRMHAFSTMTYADILTAETSSRGVHALKGFLEFAQTGVMHQAIHTGKQPDSDFEIAVMNRLLQHGYECEPQVGVAGFFIDLAVKDPGKPGRYLMGIECDGATYHSAKSARDRDRLRQQVLEGLGWNIQRIWSTDWFKNPEGELTPIIALLDKMRTIQAVSVHEQEEASEIEEIEMIQSELSEQSEEAQNFSQGSSSLHDLLSRYNKEEIIPNFPDTTAERRLLRPAMIEALVEYQPCTKAEFGDLIPAYLRQGTEPLEARAYLRKVLNFIEQFEED